MTPFSPSPTRVHVIEKVHDVFDLHIIEINERMGMRVPVEDTTEGDTTAGEDDFVGFDLNILTNETHISEAGIVS